ncbi:unnamed protein product, partial [Amoebophrya sp. A120]
MVLLLYCNSGLTQLQRQGVRQNFELKNAGKDINHSPEAMQEILKRVAADDSSKMQTHDEQGDVIMAGYSRGKGFGKGGKKGKTRRAYYVEEEDPDWYGDEDEQYDYEDEEEFWEEEEHAEEEEQEEQEQEEDAAFLANNECRRCGQTGHWERNCPQKKNDGNKKGSNYSYNNAGTNGGYGKKK